MKYMELLESEFLTDKDKIIEYMKQSFRSFDLEKLTIESDGLAYEGSLDLTRNTNKLRVQFKEVTGHFFCKYKYLTSLIGCPQIVGNHFECRETKITSLEGGPQIVGDYFSCTDTNVTSLKFCPKSIGSTFYCSGVTISDTKEYRFALYSEMGINSFISSNAEIDNIINTYGGSANRKYWPYAINLLSRVKL